MLSRDKLHESEPHVLFGELKEGKYLTPCERRDSMLKMLQCNPCPEQDVWVFAYGSLIWNPAIHFVERQVGFLPDWRRAFCMRITAGRGTEQKPGRMLALVPGDGVTGVVYRLSPEHAEQELSLLWKREMCTNGYIPLWQQIRLRSGESVNALVFVMKQEDKQFDANHDIQHTVRKINAAKGPLGPNSDYVYKLHHALSEEQIDDPYISTLFRELKQQGI